MGTDTAAAHEGALSRHRHVQAADRPYHRRSQCRRRRHATPGTTLNTPPPATTIANALTGGTGANGQGLSPIQQAQKDVSGEGGQALQPAPAPQFG